MLINFKTNIGPDIYIDLQKTVCLKNARFAC